MAESLLNEPSTLSLISLALALVESQARSADESNFNLMESILLSVRPPSLLQARMVRTTKTDNIFLFIETTLIPTLIPGEEKGNPVWKIFFLTVAGVTIFRFWY
jgi:hypothetical protein